MPLSDLAVQSTEATSKKELNDALGTCMSEAIYPESVQESSPNQHQQTNKRRITTGHYMKRTLWKIKLLETRRYNTNILLVSSTQWSLYEVRGDDKA